MRTYDLKKIQELLVDFFILTGIKICIYDSSERELCYYPERFSPFCAALREDEAMARQCTKCDRDAFAACKQTHRRAAYTCHAGLWECFSPILLDDKIIGYIAIGQVRENGGSPETVVDAFPEEQRERLRELYLALPVADMKKINAAIHILDACTGYEYLKMLVREQDDRIDARIASYIEESLDRELTVATLCNAFRLSRTELYSVFHEYFHTSVADFIKERRLQKARTLLEETRLPVGKIAVRCGIPDYNYFSKLFKRRFESSPTALRKSAKEIMKSE